MSLGGNFYALVIVNDYSRFTWTLLLATKNDMFHAFKRLAKILENEKFEHFCEKDGIKHNFSAPRTPQQNGVAERNNISLEELARTMLNETSLPK